MGGCDRFSLSLSDTKAILNDIIALVVVHEFHKAVRSRLPYIFLLPAESLTKPQQVLSNPGKNELRLSKQLPTALTFGS